MQIIVSKHFSLRSARSWIIAVTVLMALSVAAPNISTAAASNEDPTGQSLFGSYLSGRLAARQREMSAAARFYQRALAKDPGNNNIIKQALRAELATANWSRAKTLAARVVVADTNHRLARLFLGVSAFKSGDRKAARENFSKASSGPIGELSSALASAWVFAGEGNAPKAYEALDSLKKAKWAQFYRLYHRALIADVLGERDVARTAYGELFRTDQRMLRLILAYARHAAAAGDYKLARSVLNTHLKTANGVHPLVRALLSDVRKSRPVKLLVANADDGLSEVFFGLGEALTGEGGVDIGAIYLQYGLFIRPSFPMALMTLGSVYESTRRYDDAIATYARIPPDSPLFFNGEVRRAINLNLLDKVDEAEEALNGLAARFVSDPVEGEAGEDRGLKFVQSHLAKLGLYKGHVDGIDGPATKRAIRAFQAQQDLNVDGILGSETLNAMEFAALSDEELFRQQRALRVLLTLGTVQRGHEKFREAAEVYTRAINLIKRPDKRHWRYFYSRGVSLERLNQWPKAEADLKKALELNPDQPLVLNYLGYSWVDQNLHLKEALDLIKKAVKIKPDDGYFVDSLGWAYYRQANYEEATKYLERAVELLPEDPTINDHLGDAYWHVGRIVEARYQWRQSLTLEPEPKDAVIIRRKLERGLEDGKASRVAGQNGEKTKSE